MLLGIGAAQGGAASSNSERKKRRKGTGNWPICSAGSASCHPGTWRASRSAGLGGLPPRHPSKRERPPWRFLGSLFVQLAWRLAIQVPQQKGEGLCGAPTHLLAVLVVLRFHALGLAWVDPIGDDLQGDEVHVCLVEDLGNGGALHVQAA